MNIKQILNNNQKLNYEINDIVERFQYTITLRGKELLTYDKKLNIDDLIEINISDKNNLKTRYMAGKYYFDCGIENGSLFIDKIKSI